MQIAPAYHRPNPFVGFIRQEVIRMGQGSNPLGALAPWAAFIAGAAIIASYLGAVLIGNSPAQVELQPLAILVVGIIFGGRMAPASPAPEVAQLAASVAAVHSRLDAAGIPAASTAPASAGS